jgi:hypothetical protein
MRRLAAFASAVCLLICGYVGTAAAPRPLAGIAILWSNSPRTLIMTGYFEKSLASISESSGVFTPVNPSLLREELNKFSCTADRCLLEFARDAGISVIIKGELDDRNEFVVMKLSGYGTDIPFQGRIIYSYEVRIPMTGKFGMREYGFITGEHAAIFMSGLLERYRKPVYVQGEEGRALRMDANVSGTYRAYRAVSVGGGTSLKAITGVGAVRCRSGVIIKADAAVRPGDFILEDFHEEAVLIERTQYESKHGLVFYGTSAVDVASVILLTGPASATMPVIAPILGYYWNNDWQGLVLWGFDLAPYLYLEINGLANYFANYYKKKRSVPTDVQAQFYFGLYMLSAGGMSLFVDGFAHSSLARAADYEGIQRYLGSSFTAGYLALIAGGAGHFYRGYRLWGYLYFHVDNLLLYFTLREFCPVKRYSPLTRRFSTERINKTRAYSLLSALSAVKIAEIVHAVLLRDDIRNGEIIREGFIAEPLVYMSDGGSPSWGVRFSYRF